MVCAGAASMTSPVLGCVNANILYFRVSSRQAFMLTAFPDFRRGTEPPSFFDTDVLPGR